jgi:hypothetical protein
MMVLRVLRVLVLLALLIALARALARAGVALDAASLRDAVGALLRHVEQAIEQGR